jgi:hypothetical protein
MKRLTPLAVIALACALIVPATGTAQHSKASSKTVTINSVVKLSDFKVSDTTGDGTGPGDIATFTLTTFDRTGNKQTGGGHGYCILGVPKFAPCTAISSDGKGKIVLAWEDNGNSTNSDEVAIVGGTRRYRTLRGDGTITQVSPSDPFTYRLKLKGATL